MARTISIDDDILDSREIEERIDELESEIEDEESDYASRKNAEAVAVVAAKQMLVASNSEEGQELRDEIESLQEREFSDVFSIYGDDEHPAEEQREELKAWKSLRDDVCSREWRHGITFVADSHFEAYAQQFAEDIGAIPSDAAWPCTCIDWKQAANELKADYSTVEVGSATFHYRD